MDKNKTFKQVDSDSKIIKKLKKAGLSLAILLSKDDLKRFGLEYDDEIDLSEAIIIKK